VAVTYFRVRKRHTIIGANSFRGPFGTALKG